MLTIIPITAISSGLGIFIPLYILYLKGSILDIGLAFAIYNLVSVPSSLFWGNITDRYGRSKPFIIFSILLTLPVLIVLGFFHGIFNVFFNYALFAIIATAASPAINILVIGTKRSKTLPKYFSRYSIFGLLGSVIAFVFGASIAINNPEVYIYFLMFFNLISLFLALFLIKDIKRTEKEINKEKIHNRLFPLLYSLTSLPSAMISTNTIVRMMTAVKKIKKRKVFQLLGAIVLFNLAYYIFNTSYIPYLNYLGLSYNNIFLINLMNVLAQVLVFIVIIKLKNKLKVGRIYVIGVIYRSLGYVVAGAAAFLPAFFFPANVVAYIICGFSYALWNLSSSVLLYDMIRGKREGYYIGMWTSLLGASAVIGSILSSIISLFFGFQITFVVATIITISSGALFHKKFTSV